ncbi:hypothetical protein MKW94_019662 [Papaver nudicaule]|uniref:Uncharacterized protein n=1 Tax=Papaver nudicaule TaxID=74823 RepID=A0AA41S8T9_PAPNU|nr:hypothetical protein [Papaver nudicaule]
MHTTMFKLIPTFHPPSSLINKPQTLCTNFPKILQVTTNKKPFHVPLCLKDDSIFQVVPVLTTDEKLHASAFEPIYSAVKWAFSSVRKLISPERSSFVVENDLILFEHNGKDIVGVVQHVVHHLERGLMETTLLCEHGLLKNLKLNRRSVLNLTLPNEENENMWRIYVNVECMDNNVKNMVDEIKQALNAHDELKSNSEYNAVMVASSNPGSKVKLIGEVDNVREKLPV